MQIAGRCAGLTKEPENIRKRTELDNPKCAHIAKQCLIARRMVERGREG